MPPRRILILQTAFLGDLVLTTPLFEAVRRRWPRARVELVTTRSGAALLAGDPRLDALHSYDKRHTPGGLRSLLRLVRRLRDARPDLALVAQRSWRSGLIARLSGAPRRIGFAGAAGAWAYTDRVVWDAELPQGDRYAALVGASPAPLPTLAVDPAMRRRAAGRLRELGVDPASRWIALAPGSARPTKRWPAERFGRLALLARQRGLTPVIVGSGDEVDLARQVARAAGQEVAHSLAGRVPLGELPALLSLSSVVVGNDSAPAHVAAAVGAPVVVVYGPSSPRHGYAPRGAHVRLHEAGGPACRPCSPRGPRRCPRGDLACLRGLEVAGVLADVRELVEPARDVAHGLAPVS